MNFNNQNSLEPSIATIQRFPPIQISVVPKLQLTMTQLELYMGRVKTNCCSEDPGREQSYSRIPTFALKTLLWTFSSRARWNPAPFLTFITIEKKKWSQGMSYRFYRNTEGMGCYGAFFTFAVYYTWVFSFHAHYCTVWYLRLDNGIEFRKVICV